VGGGRGGGNVGGGGGVVMGGRGERGRELGGGREGKKRGG